MDVFLPHFSHHLLQMIHVLAVASPQDHFISAVACSRWMVAFVYDSPQSSILFESGLCGIKSACEWLYYPLTLPIIHYARPPVYH